MGSTIIGPADLPDRAALATVVATALVAIDAGLVRKAGRVRPETGRWRTTTHPRIAMATTASGFSVSMEPEWSQRQPRLRLIERPHRPHREVLSPSEALRSALLGWRRLLLSQAAGQDATTATARWDEAVLAAVTGFDPEWASVAYRPGLPHVPALIEIRGVDGTVCFALPEGEPFGDEPPEGIMSPALSGTLSSPGDLLRLQPASRSNRVAYFVPIERTLRRSDHDTMQLLRALAARPDCTIADPRAIARQGSGSTQPVPDSVRCGAAETEATACLAGSADAQANGARMAIRPGEPACDAEPASGADVAGRPARPNLRFASDAQVPDDPIAPGGRVGSPGLLHEGASQTTYGHIPLHQVRDGMFLLLAEDDLLDPVVALPHFCEPERVIAVHRGRHDDGRPQPTASHVDIHAAGWGTATGREIGLEMTGGRNGGTVTVWYPDDRHVVDRIRAHGEEAAAGGPAGSPPTVVGRSAPQRPWNAPAGAVPCSCFDAAHGPWVSAVQRTDSVDGLRFGVEWWYVVDGRSCGDLKFFDQNLTGEPDSWSYGDLMVSEAWPDFLPLAFQEETPLEWCMEYVSLAEWSDDIDPVTKLRVAAHVERRRARFEAGEPAIGLAERVRVALQTLSASSAYDVPAEAIGWVEAIEGSEFTGRKRAFFKLSRWLLAETSKSPAQAEVERLVAAAWRAVHRR